MADLKIPKLKKNSEKFFFKKKLTLRRKSKSRLIKESFIMICVSVLIDYINYLIPNKILIFKNFVNNFSYLLSYVSNSMYYIYQIFLFIFIVFSVIMVLILILGSFYRILKIFKRKTRKIQFK